MVLFGDGFDHTEDRGWPGGAFYSYSINGTGRLGRLAQFVHSGQKNYVFADGHVEAKTREESQSPELWAPSL